jgi:hypothetical protein
MSLIQEIRREFKAEDLYNVLRLIEAAEAEFFHISSDNQVEVFKSPSIDMTRYLKIGFPRESNGEYSCIGIMRASDAMHGIREGGVKKSDTVEYLSPVPDMYGFSWGSLLHDGREIYVENGGGKDFSDVNLLMKARETKEPIHGEKTSFTAEVDTLLYMLHPKATHIILSNGKNRVKADACRISYEYDKQGVYRQTITALNRVSLGEAEAEFKNMAFTASFLKQYVTALKKAGAYVARVSVTDRAMLVMETAHPFGTATYMQAPYLLSKRPIYDGKTVG